MKPKAVFTFITLVLVLTFVSACANPEVYPVPTEALVETVTEQSAAETTIPLSTEMAATTAEPTSAPATNNNALPPEPKIITITTEDNFTLTGFYYPAATSPAPLVVLFHWKRGNAADWNEIAPWLQNRGLKNPFANPGSDPWWDASWFPAVPAERSYGVLTFSFRGCLPFDQGGCANMNTAGWMLDTQAIMLNALELNDANDPRIVTIGASIGADAAADGCQYLNELHPDACKGALSLSPGGYLGVDNTSIIEKMGKNNPPTTAWCLASDAEFSVCKSAEKSGNSAYQDFNIPNGGHGMMMLSPNLDPLPMQLILDFLDEVFSK